MRLHRLPTLAAVALFTACASLTESTPADAVRASADAEAVRVTNGTRRPVFTFVVGRSALTRILWGPCADAVRCPPPIAPRATRTEPRSQMLLDADDREVVVHWWHAVTGPDGLPRPDSIRAFTVTLPPAP